MSACAKEERASPLPGILMACRALFPAMVVNNKALTPDFGGRGIPLHTHTLPLSLAPLSVAPFQTLLFCTQRKSFGIRNHFNKQPPGGPSLPGHLTNSGK